MTEDAHGRFGLAREDFGVAGAVVAALLLLLAGVFVGVINFDYFMYLLALAVMYALMSVGLNVQWGYAGLINFSVIAFWGVGAYAAALFTSPGTPLDYALSPVAAFVIAVVASALVAVAIGVPTLRLRADYLAIASLGLAEVIRLVFLNEREWTAGSRGVSGAPELLAWLPLEPVLRLVSTEASVSRFRILVVALLLLAVSYPLVRRVHLSPWGRAVRTVRADEDLAEALGKDSYRLKMQAFVLGSVLMAVAGWFYVYMFQYLEPADLEPLQTFYVWVAVILGGTGSNRGAVLGGVSVVAILEGTRFLNDLAVFSGLNASAIRLLLVGALIVLVVRFRPHGLLPPRRELVWPGADRPANRPATDGGDDR